MAQLSKQALIVENNSSFPNNTSNYITPAILRSFNTDMIDSLVDENTYNSDSASWNSNINSLQSSASLDVAKWNNLAAQSGSWTGSAGSGSVNTGSLLVTASVNVNVLTFTKGDNSQFSLTVVASGSVVPGTISGSAQIAALGYATTGSNRFTGSQTITGSISLTGGINNAGGYVGTYTDGFVLDYQTGNARLLAGTADGFTFYNNFNVASQSLANISSTGVISASAFIGAISASNGVVSSSAQVVGILSSLNSFTQSQATINSAIGASTSSLNTFSSSTAYSVLYLSQATQSLNASTQSLNSFTASAQISLNTLNSFTSSANTQLTNLSTSQSIDVQKWVNISSQSGSWGGSAPAGTISGSAQISALGFVSSSVTASSLVTASVNVNILTFTKGDGSQFNLTVAASGSTTPGTVSSSAQILAYNIFATTGSNTFVGTQILSGSLLQSGSLVQNGTTELSGTVLITGSTTIKGTTNFQNSSTTITGSLLVSGSTTQVGNINLLGTSTLSGSIFVSGNVEITNGAALKTYTIQAIGSNGLQILSNNGTTIATMGGGGSSQAAFAGQLTANTISASTFTGLGNLTTYSTSVASRLGAEEFSSSVFATKFATIGGQSGSWGSGGSVPAGTVSSSAQILNYNIFATTGSNSFVGNQTITGSVNVSGSVNISDFNGDGYGTIISADNVTSNFYSYGSNYSNFNFGVFGSGYDNELFIGANQTDGITFGDWNNTSNSYNTWLQTVPNDGSNPAPQFTRGLSVSGSGGLQVTGSAHGNVVLMSITSNTASMDFNAGNYFELTASVSPLRINVINLSKGTTCTLAISGSTASTITFSPNVQQPSGSAYTAAVSGQTDILSFVAFNSSKVNVVSTLKMI